MSAYFIANLQIHDRNEMLKYQEALGDMVNRYGGKYLAIDEAPFLAEGRWDYNRLVLIEFPDMEGLHKWYGSDEYQKVLMLRNTAAKSDAIFVGGMS